MRRGSISAWFFFGKCVGVSSSPPLPPIGDPTRPGVAGLRARAAGSRLASPRLHRAASSLGERLKIKEPPGVPRATYPRPRGVAKAGEFERAIEPLELEPDASSATTGRSSRSSSGAPLDERLAVNLGCYCCSSGSSASVASSGAAARLEAMARSISRAA